MIKFKTPIFRAFPEWISLLYRKLENYMHFNKSPCKFESKKCIKKCLKDNFQILIILQKIRYTYNRKISSNKKPFSLRSVFLLIYINENKILSKLIATNKMYVVTSKIKPYILLYYILEKSYISTKLPSKLILIWDSLINILSS